VKAMRTSAVEKLAACWSRTMTTDMNASEEVTWVVVGVSVFGVSLFVCVSLSISILQSTLTNPVSQHNLLLEMVTAV
jgi:multisubunit Na+/H+ antiporter MnhG subunit